MRPRIHTLFLALFVLCLACDAWLYGSLAREPETGAIVAASARAHEPLLHAYIVLGTPLVAHLGGIAAGQRVADAAFRDAYPAMQATPPAAGDLLFSESHGTLRRILVLLFWAAPVLLVLTLVTWALRSRQTHLMGRVRR